MGALKENTTYYYVAFMEVLVNGTYKEVYGSVKSFRTLSTSTAATLNKDWLEAPESPASLNGKYLVTSRAEMNGRDTRNYSILYDPSRYAALWTAYVLCSGHRGSGSGGTWVNNSLIPAGKQSSCYKAYPSVDGVTYDRGHQIPNADRNGVSAMQDQTYYWTNSTPQHHDFNGGIWARLEESVRNWAFKSDTLYVVTGCVVNETSPRAKDIDGKSVAVPVAYYKAVLSDSKSLDANGGYRGCAVYLDHNHPYGETVKRNHSSVMSIRELENKLGINLFVNLPGAVGESAANAVETENPNTVSWWW